MASAKIIAQRGTQDIIPAKSGQWNFVETLLKDTAKRYGYREMRTPTFEATELFLRGVGDTTDVVQKEMYTFTDRADRSITLKPEETAGIVRAAIENGLINDALPFKACYVTSCFRYDKPQAGRFREFHQFGLEVIGANSPSCDVEAISLVANLFERLQLTNIHLHLNSIGCPTCRAAYYDALKRYFAAYTDRLCETCLTRLEKNPMRILDCKNNDCIEIAKGAPKILDYLCDECQTHFAGVQSRLTTMGIPFEIDSGIVRGLDYYTKTVFEFISADLDSTVCGGGRYDGLVAELGGPSMGGFGFAIGLERLLLALDKQNVKLPQEHPCDLYIGSIGDTANEKASALTYALRKEGFWVECDLIGRSVKAQMKYANKLGAACSVVLGDNELQNNKADFKEMETGTVTTVALDQVAAFLSKQAMEKELNGCLDGADLGAYFNK